MKIRRSIIVKLEVEGLHNWADCSIDEVHYLAHLHRHTFQILCEVEVGHGNRDVEFIEFQHKIREHIETEWYDVQYRCCNFGSMSCEHIAEKLLAKFNLDKCSVSEDGEFWGIVEKIDESL